VRLLIRIAEMDATLFWTALAGIASLVAIAVTIILTLTRPKIAATAIMDETGHVRITARNDGRRGTTVTLNLVVGGTLVETDQHSKPQDIDNGLKKVWDLQIAPPAQQNLPTDGGQPAHRSPDAAELRVRIQYGRKRPADIPVGTVPSGELLVE
jgi:hypothetical protein